MFCRTITLAFVLAASTVVLSPTLLADGPGDNNPETVRRIPKLGVEVPPEKRAVLEAGLKDLRADIDGLRKLNKASVNELLPDIEIFHKAVNDALTYQEFFDPKEIDAAGPLLAEGRTRAAALARGEPYWTKQTGLVVRGFVSKLRREAARRFSLRHLAARPGRNA
jgi:hypothetical protein